MTNKKQKQLSDDISPGELLYYPAKNGMAMTVEVIKVTRDDVFVRIDQHSWYIPKESIDAHAIRLDEMRSKVYVAQNVMDPDYDIMYLRYVWRETFIDKLYNLYCRYKRRKDQTWLKKS